MEGNLDVVIGGNFKRNFPDPLIYCYECKNILYTDLKIVEPETLRYKFCGQECYSKWRKNKCTLTCCKCKNKICSQEVRIHVNTADVSKQNICIKCATGWRRFLC